MAHFLTVHGETVFDHYLAVEGKSSALRLDQSRPDGQKGWFWLSHPLPGLYHVVLFMPDEEDF